MDETVKTDDIISEKDIHRILDIRPFTVSSDMHRQATGFPEPFAHVSVTSTGGTVDWIGLWRKSEVMKWYIDKHPELVKEIKKHG